VRLRFRFWAGPIVVMIALQAMPLWTREKVVNAVNQAIAFLGYMFFLVRALLLHMSYLFWG
jgi:hypothetical protein